MRNPPGKSRFAGLAERLEVVAELSRHGEFDDRPAASGPVLFQYPAMMIPSLQSAIFDAVLPALPASAAVLDPFVGSGTTLTEARSRSLGFTGIDINPLAVLICSVKAGPMTTAAFTRRAQEVGLAAQADRRRCLGFTFAGLEKWFRDDVAVALGRLRRAISELDRPSARDFMWVCLAETVRRASNSRMSTYKLHVRPPVEIRRPLPVIDFFLEIAEGFAGRLAVHKRNLPDSGCSRCRSVRLVCDDVRNANERTLQPQAYDMVITSPPYGDNRTTVPYGQASYLPLQWIPASELARSTKSGLPRTAYETDTSSLGGSMKPPPHRRAPESPTLNATVRNLAQLPADRSKRVLHFVTDLDHCLERVIAASAPGAVHVWTIGDRHVGGRSVPLRTIFCEMAASHGLDMKAAIPRTLPSRRRMALRNEHAPRMAEEDSLVFVKATGR